MIHLHIYIHIHMHEERARERKTGLHSLCWKRLVLDFPTLTSQELGWVACAFLPINTSHLQEWHYLCDIKLYVRVITDYTKSFLAIRSRINLAAAITFVFLLSLSVSSGMSVNQLPQIPQKLQCREEGDYKTLSPQVEEQGEQLLFLGIRRIIKVLLMV